MLATVIAFALMLALSGQLLRESGAKYLPLLAAAGGALLLSVILPELGSLVGEVRELSALSAAAPYLETVLRVLAVGYAAEIGADICRDLGDSSGASRLELAGKIGGCFGVVEGYINGCLYAEFNHTDNLNDVHSLVENIVSRFVSLLQIEAFGINIECQVMTDLGFERIDQSGVVRTLRKIDFCALFHGVTLE